MPSRRTAETRQQNEEIPCTSSHKSRRKSYIYSEKKEEVWPDAVRSGLRSRNHGTTSTQHQLSGVADSQKPQDRNTETNKTNEGQHSRENKDRQRGMRMHEKCHVTQMKIGR